MSPHRNFSVHVCFYYRQKVLVAWDDPEPRINSMTTNNIIHILGCPPLPVTVAHEGLGWDPLLKMFHNPGGDDCILGGGEPPWSHPEGHGSSWETRWQQSSRTGWSRIPLESHKITGPMILEVICIYIYINLHVHVLICSNVCVCKWRYTQYMVCCYTCHAFMTTHLCIISLHICAFVKLCDVQKTPQIAGCNIPFTKRGSFLSPAMLDWWSAIFLPGWGRNKLLPRKSPWFTWKWTPQKEEIPFEN